MAIASTILPNTLISFRKRYSFFAAVFVCYLYASTCEIIPNISHQRPSPISGFETVEYVCIKNNHSAIVSSIIVNNVVCNAHHPRVSADEPSALRRSGIIGVGRGSGSLRELLRQARLNRVQRLACTLVALGSGAGGSSHAVLQNMHTVGKARTGSAKRRSRKQFRSPGLLCEKNQTPGEKLL